MPAPPRIDASQRATYTNGGSCGEPMDEFENSMKVWPRLMRRLRPRALLSAGRFARLQAFPGPRYAGT